MEQQAPDLAEHALLGGERRPARRRAPRGTSAGAARGASPSIAVGRGRRDRALVVVPEGVDLARLHRAAARSVAHQRARPRDQARDERDEQQRRDQHEPPRAEHVEQPGPLVGTRPSSGWSSWYCDHALGRVRPLRDQRARHRRERQQQQQDQRRAHRAQRSPHQGRRLSEGDAAEEDMGLARILRSAADEAPRYSAQSVTGRAEPASGATSRVNWPGDQQHAHHDHERARHRRRSPRSGASPSRTRP